MPSPHYPKLADIAISFPAIDNHAHPVLNANNRSVFPFERAFSESTDDVDIVGHTIAGHRATTQLAKLFHLPAHTTRGTLKHKREEIDYVDLCNLCFKPTGIQSILFDDGLTGVDELAEPYNWHNQFTTSPCKRIVRIETLAEDILRGLLGDDPSDVSTSIITVISVLQKLSDKFKAAILASSQDDQVVGFKSIVCYRTGLDVSPSASHEDIENAVLDFMLQYKEQRILRLQQKALNDYLVRIVLQTAGKCHKPVQFHTGLGDNDIRLSKSSPAHLQPIIEAYPDTAIVLLHSSYPYTREAGYLTSVYANVYLDFGEVFPILSGDGQRAVIRQVLELAPTKKILWSTDGCWWPESFYLATIQARQALCEVLSDYVRREELTEEQAIEVLQNALFYNANRLYNLGLEPHTGTL